ncbi:unnamed protein product [Caenorhabditis auriculariae]|uniref:Uncharacterized protein n=1 Tax=Caenorhabditis auriculariae TaxID=2777116 RepID=A0A8S1GWG0_9PELO|nr:unnamed protein product [Caenorhabditis auriculariae]
MWSTNQARDQLWKESWFKDCLRRLVTAPYSRPTFSRTSAYPETPAYLLSPRHANCAKPPTESDGTVALLPSWVGCPLSEANNLAPPPPPTTTTAAWLAKPQVHIAQISQLQSKLALEAKLKSFSGRHQTLDAIV